MSKEVYTKDQSTPRQKGNMSLSLIRLWRYLLEYPKFYKQIASTFWVIIYLIRRLYFLPQWSKRIMSEWPKVRINHKIHYLENKIYYNTIIRGRPCGIVIRVLDSVVVVSEFVFQSLYCTHFQSNTLGKCMILLISHHYHIYQPLRSGRIWHKDNF